MAKYLDYDGLLAYDRLIKELIKNGNDSLVKMIEDVMGGSEVPSVAELQSALNTLQSTHQTDVAELKSVIADILGGSEETSLKELADAIAKLNGDDNVDGSVKKQVKDAINAVVDGAPETFDTLKEIADWIGSDESGTAELISEVTANKQAIAANKQAIADNKQAIADNKAALDKDIKDLADHVASAGEAYTNVDNRLNNIEDQLNGSDNVFDKIDALTTKHDTEISEHDVRISAIETFFDGEGSDDVFYKINELDGRLDEISTITIPEIEALFQ